MRFAVLSLLTALSVSAATKTEPIARIDEAARVFSEVMAIDDKSIPKELLERAVCLAIVPGVKRAGFIVGGKYGKGIAVCRDARSVGWTGPSTVRVEGGSIGFQIGGGEVDLVLVVMNERGASRLMQSEFIVGGDASVMAGPVGRSAEANTDAYMTAEILSYSRARGVFAGVSLQGSTLRSDDSDNQVIYGKPVQHEAILKGQVAPPPGVVANLYKTLNRYVPLIKKTSGVDKPRTRTGTRER